MKEYKIVSGVLRAGRTSPSFVSDDIPAGHGDLTIHRGLIRAATTTRYLAPKASGPAWAVLEIARGTLGVFPKVVALAAERAEAETSVATLVEIDAAYAAYEAAYEAAIVAAPGLSAAERAEAEAAAAAQFPPRWENVGRGIRVEVWGSGKETLVFNQVDVNRPRREEYIANLDREARTAVANEGTAEILLETMELANAALRPARPEVVEVIVDLRGAHRRPEIWWPNGHHASLSTAVESQIHNLVHRRGRHAKAFVAMTAAGGVSGVYATREEAEEG